MGCDIHAVVEAKGDDDGWEHWAVKDEPNIWRNYELFALLAGVRDSWGIIPIAEPKGIPADASDVTRGWIGYWSDDGHSHSWLTLAELKAADLDQEFYDARVILSKDEAGNITSTCASTNGPHLGPVGQRKLFGIWGSAAFDAVKDALEAVQGNASDDDVRLVFFFDN